MTASECNIKNFMLCLYEGKIELVGGKDDWEIIYTTYIDLSGAADTKEVTLQRQIHNIDVRLAAISSLISFQISWYSFTLSIKYESENELYELNKKLNALDKHSNDFEKCKSDIEISIVDRELIISKLPSAAIFAFDDFKKYGHRLSWSGDWDNFQQQLKIVETKEKKRIAEKDGLLKEYTKLKTQGMKVSNIDKEDRKVFLRLLNATSQYIGYHIDKEKTMIDEFALMVKDRNDIIEQQNTQH